MGPTAAPSEPVGPYAPPPTPPTPTPPTPDLWGPAHEATIFGTPPAVPPRPGPRYGASDPATDPATGPAVGARRQRTVLAISALAVIVLLVAGVLAFRPDDGDGDDRAGPATTTTTLRSGPTPPPLGPSGPLPPGSVEPGQLAVFSVPNDESPAQLWVGELGTASSAWLPIATEAKLLPLGDAAQRGTNTDDAVPTVLPVGDQVLAAWSGPEGATIALVGRDGDVRVLFQEDVSVRISLDPTLAQVQVVSDVPESEQVQCWAGAVGTKLERVVRAEACEFTPAGTILSWTSEGEGSNPVTLDEGPHLVEVHDAFGLLLSTFDVDGTPLTTGDGRRIVAAGSKGLTVLDAASGTVVSTVPGRDVELLQLADDASSILYATRGIDGGTLGVIGEDGQPRTLVSAPHLTGQLTSDGATVLAGTQDAEGSVTLQRFAVAGGEPETLIEGEHGLRFEVDVAPDPAVIAWGPDGQVWTGAAGEGGLTQAGTLPSDLSPIDALVDPASGEGYLVASRDEASVVVQVGAAGATEVLDGWASMVLVSLDEGIAVVHAFQDGNDALVAVFPDGHHEVLDQASFIGTPSRLGDGLIYTAYPRSSGPQATVRRVPLDASTGARELHPDAAVVGGPWPDPDRALPSVLIGSFAIHAHTWVAGVGDCGRGEQLTGTVTGDLTADGLVYCLIVPRDASVSLAVDSELDVSIGLESREGAYLGSSDTGPRPRLQQQLEAGTYRVTLDHGDDEGTEGPFELRVEIE